MGGKIISLMGRLSGISGNPEERRSALPKGYVGGVTSIVRRESTRALMVAPKNKIPITESLQQLGMESIVPDALDVSYDFANYADHTGVLYISVQGAPGYFLKLSHVSAYSNFKEKITLTLVRTEGTGNVEDIYKYLMDTLRRKTKPVISHDPATGAAMIDRLIERENALAILVMDLLKAQI